MSSGSPSRRLPLWDAPAVLKLTTTHRCAGWAPSRGRACANPIALHNQTTADALLKALSRKEPDAIDLEEDLYQLARLVLCRRWHQNQADNMVEKWSARIERYEREREDVEGMERRGRGRGSSSSQSSSSQSSSTSPSRSPSSRTSSQNCTRIARLEATVATLVAELTARSTAQPPPSSETLFPRSTSASSPTSPPPSTPSSSPPSPLQRSPQRPCTNPHVRRRAIDDACPICHEDFLLRDQDALVWCKSGCGRTVHGACWERWKHTQQADGREGSCAMCRTPWGRECACT
ncbi:hypothetical protein BU23DRAFT_549649 [Bimuria novae-zelandiae CBS 107.79]|uniref:RING-type domain-containing protein n=1 Tax=Bimuria novae-zelandiae CBS 107.79 TaxID=1447943 RepID=A0A6A5VQW1_9PLEO|nr:hypothetical protein BU23DRAFT_549649 [Bimuria novae-zelandiae CBS 107.79]